jgi:lipoate-protein ligase A
MTITCRVVPFAIADGPANMALDEALLQAAAAEEESAYLRTYGWSEPTLSLGYFQSVAEARADPRWHSVPWVRRPTGGGALWHHREITYALVIPVVHPLARPSTKLYHAVHMALAETLEKQGIAARCRAAVAPLSKREGQRPFLCFTDQDPEDIVCGGIKIVGSAQRRRAGAVLQHGSLLLARSPLTPELPGIGELANVLTDPGFWSRQIQESILRVLELRAIPYAVPAEVRQGAQDLERSVYRDPAWMERR